MKHNLTFLLKNYFVFLITFQVFKILNFFIFFSQINFSEIPVKDFLVYLKFSFLFDNLIAAYFTVIPLILTFFIEFFTIKTEVFLRVILYFLKILYFFALLLCTADISYFLYFNSHLNATIFDWANSFDVIFKMIFQDKMYLFSLILLIILIFFANKFLNKIYQKFLLKRDNSQIKLKFKFILLFLTFIIYFLSFRASFTKKPLNIGDAYFSKINFLNQNSLNPVFYFIRSIFDKIDSENQKISLCDNDFALKYVEKNLHSQVDSVKVFLENQKPDRYNVILVIMESMALEKIGELTPNLNKIIEKGIFFRNIFNGGSFTKNGVYATITGFPSIFQEHPLYAAAILNQYSFPQMIRENFYETYFFIAHKGDFDYTEMFARKMGFANVFCEKNYPAEKIIGAYGVDDNFLFENSLEILNQNSEKPFFAVYLTASNHPPYTIPQNFKSKYKTEREKGIEFADFSIGNFIEKVSHYQWFAKTIFVFVADHGITEGNSIYEISLTHHKIPLIIFAPKILKPQKIKKLGSQLDVMPTILSLTNLKFQNNSLGINLLGEKRRFTFFSTYDKIVCLDTNFLFIKRRDNTKLLFDYQNFSANNLIFKNINLADSMDIFSTSMLQSAYFLLHNSKISQKK